MNESYPNSDYSASPQLDCAFPDTLMAMKKPSIEQVLAHNLERVMQDNPSVSSNPQLAKAAKVGTGTIHRIRNAQTSASIGTLEAIAKAAGVDLTELLIDDVVNDRVNAIRGRPSGTPQIPTKARVPVVGTAQLGDDGYWLELDYPVGSGDGWVTYPSTDPNTYAVRCKGDSMRPRIKPGEFVVAEPNRATSPGDEVLVKDTRGRIMVKVLNFRRNGTIELGSINEDHRPITLDLKDVEYIHYVGGILKASMYYDNLT